MNQPRNIPEILRIVIIIKPRHVRIEEWLANGMVVNWTVAGAAGAGAAGTADRVLTAVAAVCMTACGVDGPHGGAYN